MRRRLQKFLPIVLIALVVQILAPIAACWATGMAASDPLQAAFICHDNAASLPAQGDQGGEHRAYVVWRDQAPELPGVRTGSNAQARAPPQLA